MLCFDHGTVVVLSLQRDVIHESHAVCYTGWSGGLSQLPQVRRLLLILGNDGVGDQLILGET